MIELTNYRALRRMLGEARTAALMHKIVECLSQSIEAGSASLVSRDVAELRVECETVTDAETLLRQIRSKFLLPVALEEERWSVAIKLGAAIARSDLSEGIGLVEAAEAALEQASVDRNVLFDLDSVDPAIERSALTRSLPEAIAAGHMFLEYQPKLHIRDQRISSAEALVRWRHPVRGVIPPGDFIDLAEMSGWIGALTLWTIEQVKRDQCRLQNRVGEISIFVNISALLLTDGHFVEKACELLADHGGRIGFEITETAVIRDPQVALYHLQRFREIKVPLAIDDYGVGLSSLSYLKQLPASELKIDKMFVTKLTSSNRDPLIVRSTIDLAHAMEMEVTAEGVESPATLALLSVMGCDLAQGFLISRPLGIGALEAFISQDLKTAIELPRLPSFKRGEAFWKSA